MNCRILTLIMLTNKSIMINTGLLWIPLRTDGKLWLLESLRETSVLNVIVLSGTDVVLLQNVCICISDCLSVFRWYFYLQVYFIRFINLCRSLYNYYKHNHSLLVNCKKLASCWFQLDSRRCYVVCCTYLNMVSVV